MNDLKEIVKFLLSLPYAKTYKDDYIYIRCPICGDSIKHTDKPHCSIWIKPGQPLIYHCWICENSGIVNSSFLRDLRVSDYKLISSVGKYNKDNFGDFDSGKGAKFITPSKAKDIVIPKIRDNAKSKIDYISKRIGIQYTAKVLEYMRCITSLNDFNALNNLYPNDDYKKIFDILEKDYIGFLTTDKTTIIFRDITEKHKFRYIRYQIFKGTNLSDTFYTLPARVDPLSEEITLNITEGVFDIHGVFFNVNKCNLDNQLYVAVGGSGYRKVLRYFLQKGFLTNINLKIYSDKDKSLEWYRNFLEDYKIWFNSINIYYNNASKDFGVTKNKIDIMGAVL